MTEISATAPETSRRSEAPVRPLDVLGIPTAGVRHNDLVAIARRAEEAGFDAVVIRDNGLDGLDPLAAAAALAPLTRTLGLVPEVDTARQHPFGLARRLAALDGVSRGRAGWAPLDSDQSRLREAVDIVTRLWSSWPDDALVADKEAGVWIAVERVRSVNVVGRHYSVRAPLDVPRGPQGHPLLLGPAELVVGCATPSVSLESLNLVEYDGDIVPLESTSPDNEATLLGRAGFDKVAVA